MRTMRTAAAKEVVFFAAFQLFQILLTELSDIILGIET